MLGGRWFDLWVLCKVGGLIFGADGGQIKWWGGEVCKVSGSSSVFCKVQKGDPKGLADPTDLKRPPLEPRF